MKSLGTSYPYLTSLKTPYFLILPPQTRNSRDVRERHREYTQHSRRKLELDTPIVGRAGENYLFKLRPGNFGRFLDFTLFDLRVA